MQTKQTDAPVLTRGAFLPAYSENTAECHIRDENMIYPDLKTPNGPVEEDTHEPRSAQKKNSRKSQFNSRPKAHKRAEKRSFTLAWIASSGFSVRTDHRGCSLSSFSSSSQVLKFSNSPSAAGRVRSGRSADRVSLF
ncbi:hypothetical protein Q8A67_001591 [Cirrhinus molitorella]|uniref:Uncharacterized protein n=1 Tax=Cirrhinus molitorella TaxID=172907 RepID=A0AA88TV82_9TELE|nr:hypothetical protein Q8A67_001591 [Cirrhinus molitorella]